MFSACCLRGTAQAPILPLRRKNRSIASDMVLRRRLADFGSIPASKHFRIKIASIEFVTFSIKGRDRRRLLVFDHAEVALV